MAASEMKLDTSGIKTIICQVVVRFAAWLTTQPDEIKLGAMHNAALGADLSKAFCEELGMTLDPGFDWDGHIKGFFEERNAPIKTQEARHASELEGKPPKLSDMNEAWLAENGVRNEEELEMLWLHDPGLFGLVSNGTSAEIIKAALNAKRSQGESNDSSGANRGPVSI